MPTNRLANEKSPYLLQHQHNPVDWYAWGTEAFERARREQKPIFLSIGYSTCHWCHVMERESFESEEVAAVLNRDFVAIKVDREERPDVDRVYMTFVQASTGSGGWPMSVWLTPDLKPFYGGTYFPPDNRYGRPGFRTILETLAEKWRTDRPRIVQSSEEVVEQLRQHTEVRPGRLARQDDSVAQSGFQVFRRIYDRERGGFGGAPKFPRPAVHNFLLRYHLHAGNEEARDMVLTTLLAMAEGGMNDQIGGGFHRYSVDDRWFVPHFEKMLYDQAQLAASYVEAYQLTGEAVYAQVARETLDYVLRDLTDPAGGFYSAEDADSVIDPAHPHEKGEGAFYIWSDDELRSLLRSPQLDYVAQRYGVERSGNVREDPHQEFTGRNILYQAEPVEDVAASHGVDATAVESALAEARATLMAAREERVRPHRDDKVLAAWNGLMISAFARAAQALDEPRYAQAAVRAAEFIRDALYDAGTGTLLRRWREGQAAIPGFLDDYAFVVQALLDLYETTFDRQWLHMAERLTETQVDRFADARDGGFFSTAEGDENLVLRVKDDYDGAEPAGSSVAALNLYRLAQFRDSSRLRELADRTLEAFASRLHDQPAAVPQMLVAYLFARGAVRQVVLVGERDAPEMRELLRVLHTRFQPDRVALLIDSEEARADLAEHLPTVREMRAVDGRATAYVCQDYTCQLPVTEASALAALLQ